METDSIVEQVSAIAKRSKEQYNALMAEIERQNEELKAIKQEFRAMGIDPDIIKDVSKECMDIRLPESIAPVMEQFKDIVNQLDQPIDWNPVSKTFTKRFNPLNKLKML